MARISAGETFNAMCHQSWHVYDDANGHVIYVMGEDNLDFPPYAVKLTFNTPTTYSSREVQWVDVRTELPSYKRYDAAHIDAFIEINYRLPQLLLELTRTMRIRLIAQDKNKGLEWRIAPMSEPPIPDGSGAVIRVPPIELTRTKRFGGPGEIPKGAKVGEDPKGQPQP